MQSSFSPLDWGIFFGYLLLLALSSYWLSRKKITSTQEFFTAQHSIPIFAAAISLVATSQSAATFLGVPEFSYRYDFTLIGFYLSSFVGVMFVARYFVPKFYEIGAVSVYELLQKRYSEDAKKYAGSMFLLGRILASGARLYIAAIAISMILFFDISFVHILFSIILLLLGAIAYSYFGGIRSVIYSDILQAIVYVGAGVVVFVYLYTTFPPTYPIIDTLAQKGKLQFIDFSFDGKFNIFSLLSGWLLLNIAAYGLDQDMTQRVLTCKNKKEAQNALLLSIFVTIPVVLLFLGIGALLYLHYNDATLVQKVHGNNVTIFMYYILNEIPSGLKGFVTVGAIAAALSSTNSVLAAMSSVAIEDIYKPYLQRKNKPFDEPHLLRASRIAIVVFALLLFAMAVLSYFWQQNFEIPLISFALGVMSFAYTGLLGVFFSAVFTKRGDSTRVLYALIGGFVTVLALQPYTFGFDVGFGWQMVLGTLVSFGIMQIAKGKHNNG